MARLNEEISIDRVELCPKVKIVFCKLFTIVDKYQGKVMYECELFPKR